ncbi:glycine cleavage system aminomethyltransferase GcvT [Staphylococcus haemolyticus]|uniref:glycine cleavage system aminomethyltransferase GcvT n=1 Tax=Staphylococcus haemolyticus TaxID=1283 RepID=UPI0029014D86|nr:glycine cleavage system aminomethyltransferase GcvT [Staphylococcus haemolyticus]MDU0421625.1 glycine cleavage system aminomethyltransferase GcvT [Staphylococcus haemolyticus]MDU0438404.1 glycine cleavage system aminomethyltransferase GcvT [Staphylococcus haemolyticus]MDU0441663.1 glycine cleavage system aminomethyltransferase GcvT [Staphylococcus haemolyticus]MDU0443280.1 glycine cleavage system aminomethyltransferase GcvT [Staphylococcus haemolyticus]MDU0448273.1 glycine cleavage system a
MTSELKKTPLYQNYVDSGAKIVEFGGWAMPVQFTSIKEEHNAVRYEVGMFDVSHMGEISIKGNDASKFVQYLLSNDTNNLTDTKAQYTALCNEEGGIIDDLVTYKIGDNDYLLIVNAANTDKDFAWVQKHAPKFDVEVSNVSNQFGQLAVQGPKARDLVSGLVDIDVSEMKTFDFQQNVTLFGKNVILSQSGYTGEDGFEIYCEAKDTVDIWNGFIEHNVVPCGLGARDTLRLEAGLPLHGQDLTESITPYEGGIAFAAKPLIEEDFIGKSVLKDQKENGSERRTVGLELLDKGIARTGYPVLDLDGNEIGEVTSGTQAPSSGKSIAMAIIKRDEFEMGRELLVQVRKRQLKAKIVKKNQIEK